MDEERKKENVLTWGQKRSIVPGKKKEKSFGFSPSCHPTPVLHYWSPFSHFREDTFPRTTFHPSPCLFPPFGRTRNGWQKQGWWPRWRRERNIKKKKPRGPITTATYSTHTDYLVWNCAFPYLTLLQRLRKRLSFEAIGIFGWTYRNPVRLMGVDIFDLYSTLPARKPQPHKLYTS